MQLPGGVFTAGKRDRSFAFRHLTGRVELAVAENGRSHSGTPARVTAALTAALQYLGGREPVWESVHGLSVGDRQYLMQQLSARLETDERWLTSNCSACGEGFDFQLRVSGLPAKPAGPGFPFAEARTSVGQLRLRVPSGADQDAVQNVSDEEEGTRKLVTMLVVGSETRKLETLTRKDLEDIDSALETVAPEATTTVQAQCPSCGASSEVSVDPYACLDRSGEGLFGEIHRLASAYKWTESDILALPRTRRHIYLELLDVERGMVS